jgi:hypothetical protein
MHIPFFGAEIQPEHLVFFTLGFLPGFPLVFAFTPTLCTVVSKKTKFLVLADFFPWFFKTKQTAWFS